MLLDSQDEISDLISIRQAGGRIEILLVNTEMLNEQSIGILILSLEQLAYKYV